MTSPSIDIAFYDIAVRQPRRHDPLGGVPVARVGDTPAQCDAAYFGDDEGDLSAESPAPRQILCDVRIHRAAKS